MRLKSKSSWRSQPRRSLVVTLGSALLCGCFVDNAALYATGPDPSLSSTSGESDTSTTATTTAETSTSMTTDATTGTATSSGDSTTSDCPPDQQNLWFLDVDMDGHGDPDSGELLCGQPAGYVTIGDDCDDNEQYAYPGNRELCDGIDNDCNTLVDEWSELNETCDGCTLASAGNRFYAFCETALTWTAAQVACQDRGGDLLVLASESEETQLSGYTEGNPAGWWIGLSDLALEGEFVWVDGNPPGHTRWALAEPTATESENCVDLINGGIVDGWSDRSCELERAFICEIAAP